MFPILSKTTFSKIEFDHSVGFFNIVLQVATSFILF